ncbi:hypothetical protein [Shimia aestuarii]|uniref:hypothetical protein n=1 Tax=Shimia aestuarii TaxID=254406 RepID=UPI001FB41807|nr:hypothetical protein [Shimia aestuarii]
MSRQINEMQAEIISELCEIYHRCDFDREIDAAAVALMLALLGFAPLGNMPQNPQDSINAFRHIGHMERYSFTLTAISTLMAKPSNNPRLRNLFERLSSFVAPVTDGAGQNVLTNGNLFFGPYQNTDLTALVFKTSSSGRPCDQ